jgi:hypothetical protein
MTDNTRSIQVTTCLTDFSTLAQLRHCASGSSQPIRPQQQQEQADEPWARIARDDSGNSCQKLAGIALASEQAP